MRFYPSFSGTIGPLPFFTPSRIGRGGPFLRNQKPPRGTITKGQTFPAAHAVPTPSYLEPIGRAALLTGPCRPFATDLWRRIQPDLGSGIVLSTDMHVPQSSLARLLRCADDDSIRSGKLQGKAAFFGSRYRASDRVGPDRPHHGLSPLPLPFLKPGRYWWVEERILAALAHPLSCGRPASAGPSRSLNDNATRLRL